MRSRIGEALEKIPVDSTVVLTSADGTLARLGASEFEGTAWLEGGTDAWITAGQETAQGEERMATATDDVWLRPYDRGGDVTQAMNAYLEWELALVAQIEADGTTQFRPFEAG